MKKILVVTIMLLSVILLTSAFAPANQETLTIAARGGSHVDAMEAVKGEFETEGTPAGWYRIEGIRISPWRGSAINTEILAHRLTARSDRLFLVRGTTSCPDAGARAVAAKVTERTSRWAKR